MIGVHPDTGEKLILKHGRDGGFYIEVDRDAESAAAAAPGKIRNFKKGAKKHRKRRSSDRPTWISVSPGVDPRDLPIEDLNELCRLPRNIGNHPKTGEPIIFRIGKYGPFVQCGKDMRSVEDWKMGLSMSLEGALAVLAQPKFSKRATAAPLKEFGLVEGEEGPVRIMSGRYGPYVTDGKTNATLPKGLDSESITEAEAIELLKKKAATGSVRKRRRKRRGNRDS